MIKKFALSLLSSALVVTASYAATPASDNASNYGGVWTNGSNGGTGFGAWSFSATGGGGNFIGNTGDGPNSFGIFAGGKTAGDTFSATRPFTGALLANQTFSLTIGITGVDATIPGVVGLNLLDGATPVFTFKFTGGGTNWQLNDGGTDFGTNIPFAASTPITFSFTYNGGNSYIVNITDGTNTFNPTNTPFTANSTISNINGAKFFSNSQGGGQNLGFNNLTIAAIPEPSSFALLAGPAILGAWFFVRRRRA